MVTFSILMPTLPVPIPKSPPKSPFSSFSQCLEEVISLGDSRAATSGVEICHISMVQFIRGLSCTRIPGFPADPSGARDQDP